VAKAKGSPRQKARDDAARICIYEKLRPLADVWIENPNGNKWIICVRLWRGAIPIRVESWEEWQAFHKSD